MHVKMDRVVVIFDKSNPLPIPHQVNFKKSFSGGNLCGSRPYLRFFQLISMGSGT